MTSNDDEEENGGQSFGRPNAYWQRVREQQEREAPHDPDTFGGSFRGVPAVHGGAAAVTAAQTLGTEELCWCGQPLGHDWPGKSIGAKHPQGKEGSMNSPTATGLDRRDLRAYHRRLQDFIIQSINTDGLKFRLSKNSVILYPKDGSTPVTVYARNSERQLKSLQKWYLEHVYEEEKQEEPAKEEDVAEKIKELAEQVNDPVEHPQKERPPVAPEESSTETAELPKTPMEREAEASVALDKDPEGGTQSLPEVDRETTIETLELSVRSYNMLKREGIHTLGRLFDLYDESGDEGIYAIRNMFPKHRNEIVGHIARLRGEAFEEHDESPPGSEEWKPHFPDKATAPHEHIETNGTIWRCRTCLGTDHEFLADNPRGIGGHVRMWHGDRSSLYTPETRAKATETQRLGKAMRGVDAAIEALLPFATPGKFTKGDDKAMTRMKAERDAAIERAEELDAKLSLIREATGL